MPRPTPNIETAETSQTRLFTAYRLDQYPDPEGFMAQVAAVFSGYEDAVLLRATDPFRRDCIQRTHKFPPSLHELTKALDSTKKAIEAERFIAEREAQGFFWVDKREDGKVGFYNDAGEQYTGGRNAPALHSKG